MPLFHDVTREELRRGDHIYVRHALHSRHGIWDGSKVIHLPPRSAKVSRDSLDEFLHDAALKLFLYGAPWRTTWYEIAGTSEATESDEADIVVRRAESKIGEYNYNVFSANSKSFARWCKLGDRAMDVI
ncbi:PREDICTED: uncharacterized protein LOC106817422 [Priapulus caudatus]|uniref:Uncharacterized protein LOC106817422 n=1 Tax=Priapulus caudatus TaxID=37621 RepID=A0ABM1EZF3_PRICU|nr:PREDICTED: uncharacterized protein LOC106817422 [Priapulus caudatus]